MNSKRLPDNIDIQALFADCDIDFNDPVIFPKERSAEFKEWQEREVKRIEKEREYFRAYEKKRREKQREYLRAYRLKYHDELNSKRLEYTATCRDKINACNRAYRARKKAEKERSQQPGLITGVNDRSAFLVATSQQTENKDT